MLPVFTGKPEVFKSVLNLSDHFWHAMGHYTRLWGFKVSVGSACCWSGVPITGGGHQSAVLLLGGNRAGDSATLHRVRENKGPRGNVPVQDRIELKIILQ